MTKEEEIENFRREVLPEYERFIREEAERKQLCKEYKKEVQQCCICGQIKPLTAFNKNRSSNTGRVKECRECIKKRREILRERYNNRHRKGPQSFVSVKQ